jgi:RND family efflux transporter MFP subunit
VRRTAAAAAAVSGAAANGYIVARTRAALSADTPGRIVELNVREGQAVKKGFVVARLYAEEYAAALRRAEADLQVGEAGRERSQAERAAAEADLERLVAAHEAAAASLKEAEADRAWYAVRAARVQDLLAQGIESPDRHDEAQARLKAAEARERSLAADLRAAHAAVEEGRSRIELAKAAVGEAESLVAALRASRDLAQATLDKTEVRAPFDGIVVLKDAEVGEVVSPNVQAGGNARGSVVTMVDFRSLEVQAEVPEASLGAVRIGAPVKVFLDAFPDRPYNGRVDRIWPTANRQKATVEVRATFDELDEHLRPEMGARVVFLDTEDDLDGPAPGSPYFADGEALLVAEDAVVQVDGKPHVLVVERDRVRLRAVELGARRSDLVVVARGLGPGDRVVRRPPPALADGDRVLVKGPQGAK